MYFYRYIERFTDGQGAWMAHKQDSIASAEQVLGLAKASFVHLSEIGRLRYMR